MALEHTGDGHMFFTTDYEEYQTALGQDQWREPVDMGDKWGGWCDLLSGVGRACVLAGVWPGPAGG